jgi:multiple sugar transport system substrate-binding protein
MIRIVTLCALAFLLARIFLNGSSPIRVSRAGQPVSIEMSVWGMPWENDLYTKVYIPEFERQNPDIKVRFHHFEDYPNRILLSHAGGIAPDVSRQNLDFSMRWIRRGMNLPLDSYMDGKDGIDRGDFIPMLWNGLKYEGKTFGIPQDINIIGLFYNKELFDKAGIAYPDADWTWDDLKAAADKLTTDEDGDGKADVVGVDFAWNAWSYRPFLYQAGGRFWSEDGERTVIDSPEAVKALTYFKSLMKEYSFTMSSSQRGGLGPDKFFESGKVAIYLDGSWRTPSLKKNAPNLRFGVAPLPRGMKSMSVSGSCYWAVSSQTKHPEASWKLAKFLSSKEALVDYWQYLWVAPPARWSALRSPEFRNVTGAEGKVPGLEGEEEFIEKGAWISEVLENEWTTIEICNPYLDRLMLHLGEAVDKVLLQDADPATVLKEAAIKTNKQIEEARSADEFAHGKRPLAMKRGSR